MKNLLLTLTAIVIGVAALTTPANAQMAPPMDMSRMINAQLQMQKMGDQMARAIAQAYYNNAVELRKQGYTGPIPSGIDTQSINNQLVMQGMLNNQAWRQNQLTTTNAISATNNAITGHCTWYTNGQYTYCK